MRKRERGMTLIGLLLVLLMAGILVFIAIRLAPIYIQAFNIKASLDALRPDAATQPIEKLRTELVNQIIINSIKGVRFSDYVFTRRGNKLTISISHNIKGTFIDNLDFVLRYKYAITVTRRSNE